MLLPLQRSTPLALLVLSVLATPPSVPFADCSSNSSPDSLKISTIYAQITSNDVSLHFLNITLIGQSPATILDLSNSTNLLSTVFTSTKVLTFLLNPGSESQFCAALRPPSPLPLLQNSSTNYCPLPPGPFAFPVATRLSNDYHLTTLNSRIRVVDTSNPAQEIACVQLSLTPIAPGYGRATIVFWISVALAIAYWLVVGAGSLAAAWNRGRQRVHDNLWSHIQGLGFVLASAISGERFASSPALIRFATPSLRDVIFHTQWCTLLAMVTVQWPHFTYPFFAQTAWATLLYNVTITQRPDAHWDPLYVPPFQPPPEFADQLADPTSPIFVNTSIPNSFFSLPPDVAPTGIPALASAVGIRPQDAFPVVLSLFLLIIGATILFSFCIFVVDRLVGSIVRGSPWPSKEFPESPEPLGLDDDLPPGNVRFLHRPAAARRLHTGWLTQRLGQSSFHRSVLTGNLVRILILFHLPVTVFSCFQFTQGPARSSLASVILAALAFAVFSVIVPAALVIRLTTTPTSKLYEETGTLLALGPLYNHYAHGSQLFACLLFTSNVAYGVAVGCGERSGSAQAIIILVGEVGVALTTSVWLPWGRGASMGAISFMLCVARIITAVLLVILSPIVSVGDDAGGWIAYAILVIQGLVYLGLLLLLLCKMVEGAVRLVWDVSFDRSKHPGDAGILGAIALAGCCGRRGNSRRKRREREGKGRVRGVAAAVEEDVKALPQQTLNSASRTTVVSGPPSVLRPEQLTQPYREDSDDEGGYILGAWHYDDEEPSPTLPTSSPSPPASPTPAPPPGFSRVAGGRANIDAPYTMTATTATTTPADGLPPGAMAPRARSRSQSAIIEDQPRQQLQQQPQQPEQQRQQAPARKHWFGLFGAASSSSSSPSPSSSSSSSSATPSASASSTLPSLASTSTSRHATASSTSGTGTGTGTGAGAGGRSFVVIRERRPSPLSQSVVPPADDDDDPDAGAEREEEEAAAPRSFSVLRPGVRASLSLSLSASLSPPQQQQQQQQQQLRQQPQPRSDGTY